MSYKHTSIPFLSFSFLFYSILFYSHLMYYRPLLHLVSSILLSSSSPNLIWSHKYHHIQYRIVKYSTVKRSIIRYDKKQCNAQDSATEHSKFSKKKRTVNVNIVDIKFVPTKNVRKRESITYLLSKAAGLVGRLQMTRQHSCSRCLKPTYQSHQ